MPTQCHGSIIDQGSLPVAIMVIGACLDSVPVGKVMVEEDSLLKSLDCGSPL